MEEKNKTQKEGKVKKFFKDIFSKLDKKMEEKAKKSGSCCGGNDNSKGSSCCS